MKVYREAPPEDKTKGYWRYVVGGGVHAINREGVSSVRAMFYLAGLILWAFSQYEPLVELWNRAYPDNPRTPQSMAEFISPGAVDKERPTISPDDISLLVEDLEKAGFTAFVGEFRKSLSSAGFHI